MDMRPTPGVPSRPALQFAHLSPRAVHRYFLHACKWLGFATVSNKLLRLEFIILNDLEAELEIQLLEVPGWLSRLNGRLLILAWVIISGL